MECLAAWAEDLVRTRLASSLPRRWAHVQGVARRAWLAAGVVDNADTLVAAAWLHDIGYAPELTRTGFAPVDGAEFLHGEGVSDRQCALVANHSCACVETRRRGIELKWVDENTTAQERIREVRSRYGDEHVVFLSLQESAPTLLAAVLRTDERLARGASRSAVS
ncbi:HD domain-containing protein [Nocardia colli]|uniref:HD domain-containing protein n=2 Tax=Nocardia colli TaxID=2545717 RepID=A0A5N0E4A7_9NOCA|nr:HD domain-containing protein [Nocardia colli]